eukprot:14015547-Ditylum_brightwellii.AAC.1
MFLQPEALIILINDEQSRVSFGSSQQMMIRNVIMEDRRKVEDDGSRNAAMHIHVTPYKWIA